MSQLEHLIPEAGIVFATPSNLVNPKPQFGQNLLKVPVTLPQLEHVTPETGIGFVGIGFLNWAICLFIFAVSLLISRTPIIMNMNPIIPHTVAPPIVPEMNAIPPPIKNRIPNAAQTLPVFSPN